MDSNALFVFCGNQARICCTYIHVAKEHMHTIKIDMLEHFYLLDFNVKETIISWYLFPHKSNFCKQINEPSHNKWKCKDFMF